MPSKGIRQCISTEKEGQVSTLVEILTDSAFDFLTTDKDTAHSYCSCFYDREMERFRNSPIQLVEIGVALGGSIAMWSRYFPQGKILGIDIGIPDSIHQQLAKYSNVEIQLRDAYATQDVSLYPPMDVFVDDGPHTIESQVWSVENLTGRMKPGGLFIIEDIQHPDYYHTLKEATPAHLRKHIEWVDLRKVKGRYDDLIFAIHIPIE